MVISGKIKKLKPLLVCGVVLEGVFCSSNEGKSMLSKFVLGNF